MKKALLSMAVLYVVASNSIGQYAGYKLDSRWERITADNDKVISYDSKTLTTEPSVVKAWIRFDFSPKARIKERDARAARHESVKGYEKFLYRLYFWEFNCVSSQQCVLHQFDYATNGTVLADMDFRDTERWKDITPDSLGETMLSSLCYAAFQKRLKQ